MKKILSTMTLWASLMHCSSPLFALGANFGIAAGINQASQTIKVGTVEISGDKATKIGFGFDLEFDLVGGLFLDPGLMFLQKGSSVTTVSYLEVPLLVGFKLGPPVVKMVLLAGPSFGIKMGETVGGQTKTTDLGLAVGGGAEIDLMAFVIFAQARYTFSLSDVSESPTNEIKNKSLVLLAGLRFPL